MTKRIILYLIFIVLIILIAFLYNKNNHNPISVITPTVNTKPELIPSSTLSPAANDFYEVKQGDTLYSIGKKYNMLWTIIAKVNNLDENSRLIVGQKLEIPNENQAKIVQARTDIITPDQEELDSLKSAQEYALAGKETLSYRKVPIEVVKKSRLLLKYRFGENDLYIEKLVDTYEGVAIIEVTHATFLYTVSLNAYQKGQGANTVWTPVRVNY